MKSGMRNSLLGLGLVAAGVGIGLNLGGDGVRKSPSPSARAETVRESVESAARAIAGQQDAKSEPFSLSEEVLSRSRLAGQQVDPSYFYGDPKIRDATEGARRELYPALAKRYQGKVRPEDVRKVLDELDGFLISVENPLLNPFASAQQTAHAAAFPTTGRLEQTGGEL